MKFSKASVVREVVADMVSSDNDRSDNRARVNDLFNGSPPFTDAEVEENHAGTNANFLEATNMGHKARSTWNNAMLKPGNRFTVRLDRGPVWKRDAYGATITQHINKPIKASRRYVESVRATGAQVVLHGIGPSWWCNPQGWMPEEIGLDDLLFPNGTRCNLDNLSHFAIYQQFTPGQLYRLTHGKEVDPGWNMPIVNDRLAKIAQPFNESGGGSSRDLESPEKLTEWMKANAGLTDSSKVPTIDCWSFFYQDEEQGSRWFKKMIVQDETGNQAEDFIYKPRRPFAGNLSQILHLQYGDGANVAPFLYHSVRSIGFLLYAVCHLQNRLRCRFMDAVFESTLQYFSVEGEADRSLLQKIDLMHLGAIPQGLKMVTQAERWQVNEALISAGLSSNRQLMSENAAAFVQDTNDGTSKELTATEVMARLNSANALVSSLLSMAYTYEAFKYQEIARRFTLKDSSDSEVVKFQNACLRDGVPKEYLNCDCWIIEPERVMGGGNKTLELAQSKSLMEIKPQLDPPAQRIVMRKYILAVSDDADLAAALVPEGKPQVNQTEHDAQLAIGSLMDLAKVSVRQGIDHISYVDAFLDSFMQMIEQIDMLHKQGEMPTGVQVLGMSNAVKHVVGHIQIIAQDPDEKSRVKAYQDIVGRVMNLIKGYGQQIDEARQAKQDAANASEQAKAQAIMLQAKTKAQISQSNAQQKAGHADANFRAEQQRKNIQTQQDIEHSTLKTAADIQSLDAKTAATVRAKRETARAAAQAKASKPKAK